VGYVGLIPTSYPINTIYLWTRGPEEAVLRVGLKRGSPVRIEQLQRQLRARLPGHLGDWLRRRLAAERLSAQQIEQRVRALSLSFEPADIINEVMSFGAPTPIEITVRGKNLAEDRAYAERLLARLKEVPALRDLQLGQSLDYPAVAVKLDRERAGLSGVTTNHVANSVVSATSSSRFVVPNYWADPASGIGYQVQVEVPPYRMDSLHQLGQVPVKETEQGQVLLRDMAQVQAGTMPGQYDRYNMTRLVSLTANIEGQDLGRVARQTSQAVQAVRQELLRELGEARFKERFGAVTVDQRGQVVAMQEIFSGLVLGLGLAVAAIFLLLTAYFQSFRLAVVCIAAVPAGLVGVLAALLLTGTTLNLQSFMGAIMAMGVAVANAILLTTFAESIRLGGVPAGEAAIRAAHSRIRPILMTSCAMIAGMVPLAMALGEGGEQTAPLGRAVIGGLAAATLATLLLLPCVFALLQARHSTASASLDPDDPHSRYHDPASGPAVGEAR
jgi:multidrug efflux pump subunit AcrB